MTTASDRVVFIGTSDGVFRAQGNGGESFRRILDGVPAINSLLVVHHQDLTG